MGEAWELPGWDETPAERAEAVAWDVWAERLMRAADAEEGVPC